MIRLNLWSTRALCAHDRGCNRHPAFPAPSVPKEGGTDANLGCYLRRENAPRVPRCLKFESDVAAPSDSRGAVELTLP